MHTVRSVFHKRMTVVLSLLVALPILMLSCIKDDEYAAPVEGSIYMPQAYDDRASLQLYKLDTAQEITFGAAYGGLNSAAGDISVTFATDTGLIAAYNAAHGTAYVPFPADAYTISALTTIIPKGKTTSDPLSVLVLTNKLDVTTKYMLPVKLINLSAGTLDTSMSVAYFRIDELTQRERDITGQGTLTVSDENSGGAGAGEGSPKLVDNDYGTKFLSFNYNPDFWFQLKFATPQIINAYTFTSGNDAPERDPKDWTLQGSNDGVNWDILDTRMGETFASRNQTVRYEFNNSTAYAYYRTMVTQNGGSWIFQMSEWRMIQYY